MYSPESHIIFGRDGPVCPSVIIINFRAHTQVRSYINTIENEHYPHSCDKSRQNPHIVAQVG